MIAGRWTEHEWEVIVRCAQCERLARANARTLTDPEARRRAKVEADRCAQNVRWWATGAERAARFRKEMGHES